MTSRDRFVSLIKNDILRLGDAALDFGIYRILNHRRAQVESYLDVTLPGLIAAALAKLPGATADEENRVYAALTGFFSRYYDGGDFVMKARRGREAAYSVPYNGEDTHFHWATKGSHYVKSGLYFDTWRIAPRDKGDKPLAFTVDRAELPKDNNKAKERRYFVPSAYAETENEHRVTFAWRALDDKEAKKYDGKGAQESILDAWIAGRDFKSATLPPTVAGRAEFQRTEANKDQPGPVTLQEHARRFTTRHSADFFVHPQLKAFLTGELDWFLKNEFLAVWDKDAEGLVREREKLKIAKAIGESIIDFLARIEDVQAALFEKRRFVTNTRYLVMASRVNEALRAHACTNARQVAEWAWWVGQHPKYDPLHPAAPDKKFNAKLGAKLLADFPHLPIHTRHFEPDYVLRLLAEFPDLDAVTGGLLIHSENYGALRTLEPAWRGKVSCVHVDPPYNTATSGFLYKNEFQHSTWLNMMRERLELSDALLSSDGNSLCHIDENEYERLQIATGELVLVTAGTIAWDKRNPMTGGTGIATQHEYIIWRAKQDSKITLGTERANEILDKAEEIFAAHGGPSDEARKEFSDWVGSREGLSNGEKAYRYFDDRGRVFQSVSLRAPEPRTDPKFHIPLIHPRTGKPCAVPPNGFSRTPETLAEMMLPDRDEILFGDDDTTQPRQKMFLKRTTARPVSSVIQDAQKGKSYLDTLGLEFPYCHPASLYETLGKASMSKEGARLDFFAGSGTTGHAVLNLNREDGGQRKFILVEMGEYFDSVLLPRIAKVMTAPEWKDGKPKDTVEHIANGSDEHWSARTLPVVKVLELEGYEDSLDAIRFDQEAELFGGHDATTIRYVLDDAAGAGMRPQPVRVDTLSFDRPFDYRLPGKNVAEVGLPVDLAETACLMLGLAPVRLREAVRTVGTGANAKAFRFRFIEGRLMQSHDDIALLILRERDDASDAVAARAEGEWAAAQVQALFGRALGGYTKVFVNRDMVFTTPVPLVSMDAELKRVMLMRADH